MLMGKLDAGPELLFVEVAGIGTHPEAGRSQIDRVRTVFDRSLQPLKIAGWRQHLRFDPIAHSDAFPPVFSQIPASRILASCSASVWAYRKLPSLSVMK